jgi:hypothetical protein
MHVCSKCRTEWEAEGVPTDKELCATCTPRFPEFHEFRKIPRLSREIIITEKIDGTNGVIYIDEQNNIFAGSRNRWLWGSIQEEIHNDNHGFAKRVKANKEELLKLGKGYHYGEFWGKGIQRGYNLQEKKFSLFNVSKWVKDKNQILKENQEYCSDCCDIVPVLFIGEFDTSVIRIALNNLEMHGSFAANGYMNPEGIVIYHTAGRLYFKKTIQDDEKGKDETK